MDSRSTGLVRLLRPRQWVKNAFVLAPLLFSARFTEPQAVWQALLACALFSLAASATYIVNDLHDMDNDRRHPEKARQRPLAASPRVRPLRSSPRCCCCWSPAACRFLPWAW